MALQATQVTIWAAMAVWSFAIALAGRNFSLSRWLWTGGFLFYLSHILFAYHSHYDWSHEIAWNATARDTRETVGIDSGVGLLVNFAFLFILLLDLVFQWGRRQRRGASWIDGLVLFLILNGAVIFGEGAVRLFGILLLAGVAIIQIGRRSRHTRV